MCDLLRSAAGIQLTETEAHCGHAFEQRPFWEPGCQVLAQVEANAEHVLTREYYWDSVSRRESHCSGVSLNEDPPWSPYAHWQGSEGQ
jgi:hypothetical protein